jgi:hypothetical protein
MSKEEQKIHNLNTIGKLSDKERDLSSMNTNLELKEKLTSYKIGVNNTALKDDSNLIEFDSVAGTEDVYKGKANTWIVFGRDRPGEANGLPVGSTETDPEKKIGYGAKGHVKAGAIDIVVGRYTNKDAREFLGVPQGNNFSADAARIYLSQKADIDQYFNLAGGITGKSVARSAIGIKADDIRIMSRNSMKLVTGLDTEVRGKNPNDSKVGIEIIANNDDSDIQPMVKGDNLVSALRAILKRITELNGYVTEFANIQWEFNRKVATHTHYSPFFGYPTSPSPEIAYQAVPYELEMLTKTMQSLISHNGKIRNTDLIYLSGVNKKYINSKFNKVN